MIRELYLYKAIKRGHSALCWGIYRFTQVMVRVHIIHSLKAEYITNN